MKDKYFKTVELVCECGEYIPEPSQYDLREYGRSAVLCECGRLWEWRLARFDVIDRIAVPVLVDHVAV